MALTNQFRSPRMLYNIHTSIHSHYSFRICACDMISTRDNINISGSTRPWHWDDRQFWPGLRSSSPIDVIVSGRRRSKTLYWEELRSLSLEQQRETSGRRPWSIDIIHFLIQHGANDQRWASFNAWTLNPLFLSLFG
jgi:hypothetical protein